MREFTKSLFSFAWGMSLFGAKQVVNTFTPQERNQPFNKTTRAFNEVTYSMNQQLDDTLRMTFMIGDNMQRGMVDMMFGLLSPRNWDPNRMMRMTGDMMQQSGEAFRQAAPPQSGQQQQSGGTRQQGQSSSSTGWGPMPQSGGQGGRNW